MADDAKTATKPLKGVRVLELGGYIAAPYATSLLASLGADVVKVERQGGDDFRRGQDNRSLYFIQYNAGKRSLGVDLRRPEGVAVVNSLLPRFDVVVENLRPGRLAAIGLGYDDCLALRPDVIFVSVNGFGDGGPLRDRPAYDTMGQAFGGLYSILSNAGSPHLSGTCMADLISGLTTAAGVLAALVGRASSGQTQRVETSIMEAVSVVTVDALTQYFDDDHRDPSRQSRHPQAQNFCVATSTGENIAIHLSSSQKFWLCLLRAMGRHELADDPRFVTYNDRVAHYFELAELVAAEFGRKSVAEWEELLTAADVPYAPVLTASGYLTHPQTDWLELVEPERNGVSLLRAPWRFGGSRPDRSGTAPRVGQHTREIALEVYDAASVDQLVADGVLFEP